MKSWANHTSSYWKWRQRPNVLTLTFDDIKRDLPGTARRTADMMRVTLTQKQLDSVIERSGLKYIKNIEHKFTPPKLPFMKNASMIRKGQTGNSSELLSREQQAAIDDFYQSELRRLGSDFPYSEIFNIVL